MSGPIVRTGTTPEFWKNWDQAFGKKQNEGAAKKKTGSRGTESGSEPVARKAAKGAAKKKAAKKKK